MLYDKNHALAKTKQLVVIDKTTGNEVKGVISVDPEAGWVLAWEFEDVQTYADGQPYAFIKKDAQGVPMKKKTEGSFEVKKRNLDTGELEIL